MLQITSKTYDSFRIYTDENVDNNSKTISMPIITLTSDLGLTDHYVASIKGKIFSKCNNVQIVDVSHNIQPYNIGHAAFVLRNCYAYFPANTIHLICVNNEGLRDVNYLLAKHQSQYFLAADNGVFSILFDGMADKTFELIFKEKKSEIAFAFLDTIVPAACALANGGSVDSIARPVSSIRQMHSVKPSIGEDYIRANVLYIDHFENVILNVTKQQFEKARQGRNFYISFRRNEVIDRISNGYSNTVEGEKLCLFNSSGYLEIAINHGKASSLLGLNEGESVKIEFK